MTNVSRRQLLGTCAVGLGSALAGCSGPLHLGVTGLGEPSRTTEDRETNLAFRRDGEEYLTLSVLQRSSPQSSRTQLRFRLSTSHRDGTRLGSMRYHLYLADRDQDFSEFYLQTPGGRPWPEMTFERDKDGRGVHVNVPDLGFQGTGTVSLDFILEPDAVDDGATSVALGLDASFRLSDTDPFGRNYRAETSQTVALELDSNS